MRQGIYKTIDRERDYQDGKWGTPVEHPHEVTGWLEIMYDRLNKARHVWLDGGSDQDVMREILQAVAVGVAAMEQLGVWEREK